MRRSDRAGGRGPGGVCGGAASHVLEAVEHLELLLVVPLGGDELVEAVDGGQAVHHVGAEERVDVVRCELTRGRSVLGPVGHVTHQLGGRGWGREDDNYSDTHNANNYTNNNG